MTKSEKAWNVAIKDWGCIACRKDGNYRQADAHHILRGGRRIGHMHTIPLCPFHHRSVPPDGMTKSEARDVLGPTLCDEKRAFEERYGTELELLEQVRKMVRL